MDDVQGVALIQKVLSENYPTFEEYAKLTVLYIASAGVMVQVIKRL